jgi:di/tricarboxylate transporter
LGFPDGSALMPIPWEGWFSIGTVALCFGLLAFTRFAPDIVMAGGLTLLLLAGILTPEEALAGFANEGMLTVAVLYIVVSGLTETGSVGWISQAFLGRPRSPRHAQLKLMVPVAALSAFLNNTPVVAVFIPALTDWAKRHRLSLSRLLIPLSFASIAGGTCTLIGTSTNLVVNGLMTAKTGNPSFGLFELLWIGLPLVIAVVVFVLVFGQRLLPERLPALNRFADAREYSVEMLVEAGSPLIGKSIEQAGLRQLPGMFLMEIDRAGRIIPAVSPQERLQAGDRLVFVGVVESVVDLQKMRGLKPATDQVFKLDRPRPERGLTEAVVSDSCPLVGKTVRDGRFRTRYNAVIIALARNGERLNKKIGDIVLRPGDTLLLETYPSFREQQRNSRDFFLVSEIGDFHPPRHDRALVAVAIALLMVVTVSLGWLSMLEAALLSAGLMIITRCTSGRVARRAPDWQVLVVIATSFGIGTALQKTGAAGWIAEGLLNLSRGEPWPSLALVFLVTALFTSLATNNVAAVLMFPIAFSAAQAMDVSMLPFAVTIMVAASASFATPIGYQTNLMVFNAGGYHFGDFLRIGIPLTLVVGVLTVLIVPLVWQF